MLRPLSIFETPEYTSSLLLCRLTLGHSLTRYLHSLTLFLTTHTGSLALISWHCCSFVLYSISYKKKKKNTVIWSEFLFFPRQSSLSPWYGGSLRVTVFYEGLVPVSSLWYQITLHRANTACYAYIAHLMRGSTNWFKCIYVSDYMSMHKHLN